MKHNKSIKFARKRRGPDAAHKPRSATNEPRFLIIACIAKKHWSAVVTHRGNAIRIISVRRSRKTEVDLYES